MEYKQGFVDGLCVPCYNEKNILHYAMMGDFDDNERTRCFWDLFDCALYEEEQRFYWKEILLIIQAKNVGFSLAVSYLVIEYFTPTWPREIRQAIREVIDSQDRGSVSWWSHCGRWCAPTVFFPTESCQEIWPFCGPRCVCRLSHSHRIFVCGERSCCNRHRVAPPPRRSGRRVVGRFLESHLSQGCI